MRSLVRPFILCFGLVVCTSLAARAEITAEKTDTGVTVKIDGQPFTEYVIDSGGKPILWPIIGPTGKPVTRAYPMVPVESSEKKPDHVHHRSFWFAHGWVNGVDFWTEGKNKKGEDRGKTVHKEFTKVEGGKQATIVARNDWMSGKGEKVAEDERTLRFSTDGDTRIIDFDVTVKATNGPVTFGDTKEGTFGIRVADSMRVTANQGGKIINSNGLTNKDMWGKPASWIDYMGPVDGETVGIAVLNHPTSFHYPTHWQVRPYGLLAVNPFGLTDYEMEINTGKGPAGEDAAFSTLEEAKARKGTVTIESGDKVTFRYRILLHKGDEKAGKVAEAFEAYSKQP